MEENKKIALSKGKKIAIGAAAVVIVAAIAIGVFANGKLSKIKKTKIEKNKLDVSSQMEDEGETYFNIALFGIDAHSDKDKKVQSDAIVIVSLNNETKEVKLVNIYGNALLAAKDGKVVAAKNIYHGGAAEAIAVLNRNLDLNIEHFATIDFKAMIDVIDYVGGVEIDVQEEEIPHITGYTADLIKVTGKDAMGITKAGPQVLNGTQATAYCRIRATKGADTARAGRQQEIFNKVFQKVLKLDLGQMNEIMDKVFPKLETNFKLTELLNYAKDLSSYKIAGMEGFPYSVSDKPYDGVKDAVVPADFKGDVLRLHQQFFPELSYEPSEEVVKAGEKLSRQ